MILRTQILPDGSSARGFSLIEVLITIVIISFGMLGIAGMMLRSIDAGNVTSSRNIAVWQANEMADRMRANMAGVRAGNYNNLTYSTVGSCSSPCWSGQCSAGEQASLDFCLWNAQIQKALPMGRGNVALSNGGNCFTSQFVCAFDITVSWDETKTGSTSSLKSYVLRVEP